MRHPCLVEKRRTSCAPPYGSPDKSGYTVILVLVGRSLLHQLKYRPRTRDFGDIRAIRQNFRKHLGLYAQMICNRVTAKVVMNT